MGIPEFIYTVLLKPAPLRKAANLFLKSILPKTVKVKSAVIHLNPADPVVSGALALHVYEKDEIEFFAKWFQPNMNFVDVGANVGLYTGMALVQKSETSIVLSVEPEKSALKYLKKTININSKNINNVIICPLAVSDKSGETILYKNIIGLKGLYYKEIYNYI